MASLTEAMKILAYILNFNENVLQYRDILAHRNKTVHYIQL